ncbi:MAG: alkaline phosphatase family protein, partial [Ginsengibacter sp.]
EIWESSVMVLYYDEHGGFYDHVPPPPIPYKIRGKKNSFDFESLGPRIPGILISPFTEAGSVIHDLYDHTSVLQLLAEIFTPGKNYSPNVELRRKAGIKSLSGALNTDLQSAPPPLPPFQINVQTALGKPVDIAPATDMQLSFENAALKLMKTNHDAMVKKFPEVFQWRDTIDKKRR